MKERGIDLDRSEAVCRGLLNKVMTDVSAQDIEVLEELRKVYKRTIPFSKRMYVAAYLLKGVLNTSHQNTQSGKASSGGETGQSETAAKGWETTRVIIDEDKAATIFLSIGKARRVFPRDLVGLFVNVAGLDRQRVGDIRVLPNYSFVQIYKEDAQKAIDALNGYEYRGKQLAVSYSRGKVSEE